MTHALTLAAGILLAALLLLTAITNITPVRRRWLPHGQLEFIPNWALFANPRVEDFTLLRRDLMQDGTLTRWREVRLAGERRRWNMLWNPELGVRRAFLAVAAAVATQTGRRPNPVWPNPGQGTGTAVDDMISLPQMTLLRYLSERSPATAVATQYMIVALRDQAITGIVAASGDSRVVFVSEMHLVRRTFPAGTADEHTAAGVAV